MIQLKQPVFQIREFKINNSDTITGVDAISLVDNPAIELDFELFKADYTEFFKYTAAPDEEVLPTSHPFCRMMAGGVFHISEIQKWDRFKNQKRYEQGFIQESDFFQTFDGTGVQGFNCSNQLYNCRHHFERINGPSEIPKWKKNWFEADKVYLSVENEEKRIISGPILVSGKLIYRNNIDGFSNPGYCYFSRQTVRDVQKKYGLNRKLTLHHREDITGTAIMTKSYVVENEEENVTTWMGQYQVISERLWEYVKAKKVLGFSLEGIFKF